MQFHKFNSLHLFFQCLSQMSANQMHGGNVQNLYMNGNIGATGSGSPSATNMNSAGGIGGGAAASQVSSNPNVNMNAGTNMQMGHMNAYNGGGGGPNGNPNIAPSRHQVSKGVTEKISFL